MTHAIKPRLAALARRHPTIVHEDAIVRKQNKYVQSWQKKSSQTTIQ